MRVQLRRYTIAPDIMDDWVAEWTAKIRPLRQALGFTVLGAWRVDDSDEFIWLLAYDGPQTWEQAERAYYDSPQRAALDPDPARHITAQRVDFVQVVA